MWATHTLASIAQYLQAISNWLSGKSAENPEGYRTFAQGLNDPPWVLITALLDALLASGFFLLALHWWASARRLTFGPAKRAQTAMRNVFLACAITSGTLVPIRVFWPAWRLYDLLLLLTVVMVWRHAYTSSTLELLQREISRAQRLERDLASTRAQISEKAAFFNALSHDLRTPLNGIVLQSHIIETCVRNGDSATLLQSVDQIRTSARRSEQVLDALLTYAQIEATAPAIAEFSLRSAVERAIEPLRDMAQRKNLQLTIGGGEVRMHSDREKLRQALTELVENAIKFTDNGSVHVRATPAGERVRIEVTDTGPGLDEQQQGQLFRELSQITNPARDNRGGIGLGLVIARRLALQLGGTIGVESRVGAGSCFTIDLPVHLQLES